MRYFAKQGGGGRAVNLYRFEVGKEKIIEDYWTKSGWKHDQDAEIAGYLALGEGDFIEVSEKIAHELFPDIAFQEVQQKLNKPQFFKIPSSTFKSDKKLGEVAGKVMKKIRLNQQVSSTKGRRLTRYKVVFSGSSLIGELDGIDNFNKCLEFLNQKSVIGQLKCFSWWCEECKSNPMKKGADPVSHVIKITFPNVVKLLKDSKVQWQWKDPQSDFAKKSGNANSHFKKLVLSKSKPNWIIRVTKNETGIDYKFMSDR